MIHKKLFALCVLVVCSLSIVMQEVKAKYQQSPSSPPSFVAARKPQEGTSTVSGRVTLKGEPAQGTTSSAQLRPAWWRLEGHCSSRKANLSIWLMVKLSRISILN